MTPGADFSVALLSQPDRVPRNTKTTNRLAILRRAKRTRQPKPVRFPNKEKGRDSQLNELIRRRDFETMRAQKALIAREGIATKVTKSGAGVVAD